MSSFYTEKKDTKKMYKIAIITSTEPVTYSDQVEYLIAGLNKPNRHQLYI